jgi:hypothetical protein
MKDCGYSLANQTGHLNLLAQKSTSPKKIAFNLKSLMGTFSQQMAPQLSD